MGSICKYYIAHRFKDEIVIPFVALTNNIDFCLSKDEEKICCTADNVMCEATYWEERHMCELAEDVKRIYGITNMWDFIMRWYGLDKHMNSMYFLRIKLKKI
jgi:hypothetical protein